MINTLVCHGPHLETENLLCLKLIGFFFNLFIFLPLDVCSDHVMDDTVDDTECP